MTTRRLTSTALLTLACLAVLHAPAHGQITQRWLTQWGTAGSDNGSGVVVDGAGQTWVAGYTAGALGGPNAGSFDLFLTPLSPTGVLGTSVQRGSTSGDYANAAALVGGNTVFGVGYTSSTTAWDGEAVIGSSDPLAVGYTTAGTYQSTTRFGSPNTDVAFSAAGNATHLLIAGYATGAIDGQAQVGSNDAFLSKRDSTGALVWTRVVGTSDYDAGSAAAFDSAGSAYLAGLTNGNLPTFTSAGSSDFFIARYDASGTQTLLRQIGSSGQDDAEAMQVDGSGNIYLTGYTTGALGGQANSGGFDAFLTKLDSSGNVLWTRLLGGTGSDFGSGLALDTAGHVWIGGFSSSSLAGHTNAGNFDAFVAQYDSDGTLLATRFWGGTGDDEITDLAAAPDGSVSVSGSTNGTLGAANVGGYDAWAASVTTVPEPTAALLLAGAAFPLLLRRRR